MCGFVGVFSYSRKAESQVDFIKWANSTMYRRGPDSEGFWNNSDIALGFRRLAIRDLNSNADQPMFSVCGRYVIVFNGELYAIENLRQRLKENHSVNFVTSSDTEVLLYALINIETKDVLKRIDGIFAFAFYDRKMKKIILGRDRSGVKPLYVLKSPEGILFSSQYDHITNHKWNKKEIDPSSLKSYLQFGYVPNGYALYKNSYSLPNGSYQVHTSKSFGKPEFYYEYGENYNNTKDKNSGLLEESLKSEVNKQLVSDVPIGVFLSGGVDSPLVSYHSTKINNNISSFTIDIDDERFSEGALAEKYAKKFKVYSHVKTVGSDNYYQLIDDNIKAYSEPFNDYSSLPTLMVSSLAREKVTVCLSGDGGDELFYGYDRNKDFLALLKTIKGLGNKYKLNLLYSILKSRLGKGKRLPLELLKFNSLEEYYIAKNSITGGKNLADFLLNCKAHLPVTLEKYLQKNIDVSLKDKMHTARKIDVELHLPRILMKVDRASMYHSLEVRVPMLGKDFLHISETYQYDRCIIEKENIMQGKYPLKQHLSDVSGLDNAFFPKKGFSIPMKEWLHGELKHHVYSSLQNIPKELSQYLKQDKVDVLLKRFYEEDSIDAGPIWGLFTLVKWHDHHTIR